MKIRAIQNIIDRYIKKHKIIDNGKNNTIITKNKANKNFQINIYGDNNTVEILTEECLCADINIGLKDCPANNCKVFIGENTTSNGMVIFLAEDNSEVIISKDCMISAGVQIWASDTHAIFNPDTKELLNLGEKIVIDDHCWIGYNAIILKNTYIPKNSICAFNSVITQSACKNFNENTQGVVFAGNPAKVVKENVNWDRRRPKQYLADLG